MVDLNRTTQNDCRGSVWYEFGMNLKMAKRKKDENKIKRPANEHNWSKKQLWPKTQICY